MSLLLTSLFYVGAVQAQEQVLYIEITITDYGQTAAPPIPTPANQAFLDQLTTLLDEQNITPIFVESNDAETYPYFWEQPALHLSFSNFPDQHRLSVTPYVTMRLPSSSVLAAAFSAPLFITITPEQERSVDTALTLTKGMAYYALGRWDDGIAIFDQVLRRPENFADHPYTLPSIQFYLANSLLENEQPEKARVLYETILDVPSYDRLFTWTAAVNLAWIKLQDGNTEAAFEQLDEAIDALLASEDYFSIYALTRRSQLYARAFRFEEAIADMDAAIAFDPDNPLLYVERGQRILLLYEWDRALADYNYAIELNPEYADAYYYRGILYASAPEGVNARAEALADFQRYLELAPNGSHAEDAARYAEQIAAQLEAVGE